ncbi:LysR family transcriptional regulator, partial [Litoreibacter sp.]|nr:LysR family transcriptional regulator [Litoreibacter sp.]
MDRLTEMEAFATVVDQGGFTDAARKMGISKSAVSKHVSSLETRLGARLLNRTTRRVSPTEIGLAYYDRARRVLNDAGEADALVSSMQSAPSGLLRISVATDFGVNHMSPILGDFLADFPDITVNMVLNNRYVELISEGFDLAIRIGEMEDSSLRARKLTETTKRLIAAPSYYEQYGRPEKIDDLNEHKLLHYSNQSAGNVWKLTAPSGEKRQVRTQGWLTVNDGQSLLNACVSGLGIAYLPSFLYAEALDAGLVEEALPGLPTENQGIYAVYPPGRYTQPKVRTF